MDRDSITVTAEERKYKTVVTQVGKAKIAAAALTGKKVNVVAVAVGDGGGGYYLPTEDMTALKHEVWRGPVAAKEINHKSPNMIDVKGVVPGGVGGFNVREFCILDDEDDMIALCNLPTTEKAAIEEGIPAALTILMHIVVTDADALEFTLDPTIDTATAFTLTITIPKEGWETRTDPDEEGAGPGDGPYPYRVDVEAPAVTALHKPFGALMPESLGTAEACELCPTVETVGGALRFRAKKVPTADMTGEVLLVTPGGGSGNGGGGGGGDYTLPTATAFRLGGVKIGDGVNVRQDGTITVDAPQVMEELAAPEDDVDEMLNKVFGAGPAAEGGN